MYVHCMEANGALKTGVLPVEVVGPVRGPSRRKRVPYPAELDTCNCGEIE